MKAFGLIPRVRVNYTVAQLLKAVGISDRKWCYRDKLLFFLRQYFERDNIVLTASGRGSLYHILRSLPHGRVLVPGYICDAVYDAVKLAGKEIVWGKTSGQDYNLIVDELLIDSNIIVLAPHQYGFPCDIENLVKICKKKGAVLIEDCAGALGSTVAGRKVGTWGDFGFFSFDSSKLVNVPSKGGFIVCNNSSYATCLQSIEQRPPDVRFKIKHIGRGMVYCLLKNIYIYRIFHYLMMGRKQLLHLPESEKITTTDDFYLYEFAEWQAYIAYLQLINLEVMIEKRRQIYQYYTEYISKDINKPPVIDGAVCIRYPIKISDRKRFYELCTKCGVDFNFSFSHINCPQDMVEEHVMANQIMNLPFYWKLTEKESKKVVSVLNEVSCRMKVHSKTMMA